MALAIPTNDIDFRVQIDFRFRSDATWARHDFCMQLDLNR